VRLLFLALLPRSLLIPHVRVLIFARAHPRRKRRRKRRKLQRCRLPCGKTRTTRRCGVCVDGPSSCCAFNAVGAHRGYGCFLPHRINVARETRLRKLRKNEGEEVGGALSVSLLD